MENEWNDIVEFKSGQEAEKDFEVYRIGGTEYAAYGSIYGNQMDSVVLFKSIYGFSNKYKYNYSYSCRYYESCRVKKIH